MLDKAKLSTLRFHIDGVDAALMPLFKKRMEYVREVAQLKADNNLAIKDEAREEAVVANAQQAAGEELRAEAALFMRSLMSLSRMYQHRLLFASGAPLLPPPTPPARGSVTCAYQGVPGAWGEAAAAGLFPGASLTACGQFEDVFLAVKQKTARYGVVPIENSKTGAIGETYDLLRKYGCYIVRRTWVPIRQCLVGVPGAALADVREVHSHPEGFKQCGRFLQGKNWEQTACRNTAVAAQRVAEAASPKQAAIAGRRAAELYGLSVLAPDIMDAPDNRTNFVVIALNPEYGAGSNLISLTFSTLHRSGALCEALLPFMAENLNLMRIESRPAGEGKYRFFAEIQGDITDEKTIRALRQAEAASAYFEVLGCYQETPCKGDL